jgi:hypothetical protein
MIFFIDSVCNLITYEPVAIMKQSNVWTDIQVDRKLLLWESKCFVAQPLKANVMILKIVNMLRHFLVCIQKSHEH